MKSLPSSLIYQVEICVTKDLSLTVAYGYLAVTPKRDYQVLVGSSQRYEVGNIESLVIMLSNQT